MNEKYFYEVNIFPIFERAIRKLVVRYKNSIFLYLHLFFLYYICHPVIGNICNKGTNCTCFASCRRAILKLIGICSAATNAAVDFDVDVAAVVVVAFVVIGSAVICYDLQLY